MKNQHIALYGMRRATAEGSYEVPVPEGTEKVYAFDLERVGTFGRLATIESVIEAYRGNQNPVLFASVNPQNPENFIISHYVGKKEFATRQVNVAQTLGTFVGSIPTTEHARANYFQSKPTSKQRKR